MKALANASEVLLSGDGVGPKRPLRRTTQEPEFHFADAPALIEIKQQAKPDKNAGDKTAASAVPGGEQVVLDTRTRGGRFPSETGGAGAIIDSAGQAAGTSLRPERRNVPKAGSTVTPSSEASEEEPLPAEESMGPVPHGILSGSGGWPAGRTLSPQGSLSPEGRLLQTAMRTEGDPRGARSNTVQAGTAKPVLVDIDTKVPGGARTENEEGKGPMATAATPNMGQKGQATAANRAVEPGLGGRAPVTHYSTADTKLWAASKAHASVTAQTPDQTLSKTPSPGRHPVVETSPQAQPGLQGRPSESHPRMGPKHDGASAGQNPRMDVGQPGAKEMRSAHPRDGANPLLELPAPSAGQPAAAVSHASDQAQMREGADAGAAENPMRDIGEQILDSLRASVVPGDRQIVIRLQPSELGTVVVRLREQDRYLDGTVEVGESDTRLEIEQALPDVIRSLQEAGIPIRRFDVTTGDSPEQGAGRGLPQQDGGAGHHSPGQGRDSLPASSVSRSARATDASTYPDPAPGTERQVDVSGGQIDMLL